jgi:hypothetical protein
MDDRIQGLSPRDDKFLDRLQVALLLLRAPQEDADEIWDLVYEKMQKDYDEASQFMITL